MKSCQCHERNTGESLTYSVKELGAALGLSASSIYEGLASGKIIAPVRIGRRVFWRKPEVILWLDAGCPPRCKWESDIAAAREKIYADAARIAHQTGADLN